ncbi:hypothetical protein RFI_02040 [Reticulomyxa filosa]|uniref:Uncharacterized protein n=1 Tax=Reticulomyxa filosa TaxID=46433 RepID=X6P932_RETFI|nr:hypothetical protein RFI_02040 [Reticulomyxa filosa]|eukprot:ETO35035.1 hypothetical protein RFI_02040 [Reticulomyxa filosa]
MKEFLVLDIDQCKRGVNELFDYYTQAFQSKIVQFYALQPLIQLLFVYLYSINQLPIHGCLASKVCPGSKPVPYEIFVDLLKSSHQSRIIGVKYLLHKIKVSLLEGRFSMDIMLGFLFIVSIYYHTSKNFRASPALERIYQYVTQNFEETTPVMRAVWNVVVPKALQLRGNFECFNKYVEEMDQTYTNTQTHKLIKRLLSDWSDVLVGQEN